jgi:hypothetical protein
MLNEGFRALMSTEAHETRRHMETITDISWDEHSLDDGAVYYGDWTEFPHGRGLMVRPDGSVYEGQFECGVLEGNGRMIYSNGDCYAGSWFKGQRHSKGSLIVKDSTYIGEFKHDYKHGLGKETWKDESCFKGLYKKGLRTGQGQLVWSDSSFYEGSFIGVSCMAMEGMSGKMARCTTATGQTVTCMDKGLLTGLMDVDIKGSTAGGRSKGMGLMSTLMDGCTKGVGLMAVSMGRANSQRRAARLLECGGKGG